MEGTPQTADDFVGQGWIQYSRRNYVEAEADFRRAIQLDDRLLDGHYGLGVSARAQGRTAEAIESMKKAQAIAEDDKNIDDPGRRTIFRQLIAAQISILQNTVSKET
jgi:tetratricopeptide (TPR) repeat protein